MIVHMRHVCIAGLRITLLDKVDDAEHLSPKSIVYYDTELYQWDGKRMSIWQSAWSPVFRDTLIASRR